MPAYRIEAMALRVVRWATSKGSVAVFFDGTYHLQRVVADDRRMFGNYGRRRLVGIYDQRAKFDDIVEDLEFAAARHA